jgi:hypothetical protein
MQFQFPSMLHKSINQIFHLSFLRFCWNLIWETLINLHFIIPIWNNLNKPQRMALIILSITIWSTPFVIIIFPPISVLTLVHSFTTTAVFLNHSTFQFSSSPFPLLVSECSQTRSKKKLNFGCHFLQNSLLGNVYSDPINFSTLQKHHESHFP